MKVEFHSGVADTLAAACRILRKAHSAGAKVVVCGAADTLDRLDIALWSFEPLAFVAHVRLKGRSAPAASLLRTPIWLVDDPALAPAREVLLNLGQDIVAGWEEFARVIEIVSAAPEDAAAGRQRWRHYGERPGVELVHHVRAAAAKAQA